MWGRHLVLDCAACDREAVGSEDAIKEFCADLVASIGVEAHGEPLLKRFATHLPEAAGYSLAQPIGTSAVTAHFAEVSGDIYLDVFSCKDFDSKVVVEMVRRHLRPRLVRRMDLCRSAPRAVDVTFSFGERIVPVLEDRTGPIEDLSA